MITGSDFVKTYAAKGYGAWEGAMLALARADNLTPWPWTNLELKDDRGNTATLRVQTDVLAIGPIQDAVRVPLTPGAAQNILNLYGWLLPTPWMVYQMYRAAETKLSPIALDNKGADLVQYAAHSAAIDAAIRAAGKTPGATGLLSGIKKDIVVSNIAEPKKVLIFGWYKPEPDVYNDKKPWEDPTRQPRQVNSNAHGDFYVDYSHGIHAVGPEAMVNGVKMNTVDLYQHPTLSRLVSNEGPIQKPRYPARVPPAKNEATLPAGTLPVADRFVLPAPSLANQGLGFLKTGES